MAGAVLQQTGLNWPGIAAAGACVPGIYYADRGEAWAPNLWGWDAVPLRNELSACIPAPVTIDSDRSAYVLGETWIGAARGLTDVVFLAVGTGIGAGILSGGRVIRGAQGIAGAVGWFALNPGRNDLYRRAGCFESEAAGPAVARRYAQRTGSTQSLAAEAVCAAARSGDAAAIAVLEETAVWLGMGIANLISTLNPQMVVLGGGLMQAGDLMVDTIRRTVLDWAQPLAARDARIELSRLGEDAGLMGAARLALDSVDPQS
jgi:glucokinase